MPIAETLLNVLAIYAALGVAFAIAFIVRGLTLVDPVARGASVALRLHILPGAAACWPILLVKWIRAATGSAVPPAAAQSSVHDTEYTEAETVQ